MSLLRRVGPLLERRSAQSTAPFGDSSPPSPGSLGGASAGTSVTEKTALQVAAVYGSVGVLSDALATLPLELLNSDDAATRKRLPRSPLLTQPFVEISLIDWLVQYTISLALRGNFFGQIIERDPMGYATQIRPIHPDHAVVRRLGNGVIEYRFNGQPVSIGDVFHVRYMSVGESLVGLNPIEYLRNTLGLARAADLYGGAFFANSARPDVVLEVPDDLDPDETVAMAQAWTARHQGIGQSNLPAVVTGGTKVSTISINPEDAQFLQSRQYDASVITGQIFRVPPHMIGIVDRSTSWGTGIEAQERGFVVNTLGGYIGRLEQALTTLHPPQEYVRFNLSGRLRGNKLERYQSYALGMAGGWLCADDVRAEEDMPPVADGLGKTFMVPINSQTLQQAVEEQVQAGQQQQEKIAGQSGDQPQQNGASAGRPARI